LSAIVRRRVTVKKARKCLRCGQFFDGEKCSCGSGDYTEVYVMVGG
jgi:hypothetical protein